MFNNSLRITIILFCGRFEKEEGGAVLFKASTINQSFDPTGIFLVFYTFSP